MNEHATHPAKRPAADELRPGQSHDKLWGDRSFWGITLTQFLGAFNDNLFKQALLLLFVAVPLADGTTTEWILTTASIQTLTRQGLNKTSIKPGESLKITALPARNGNPAGFIRRVELGDKTFNLVIE